jgi:prepilin-type N-terminal cleavage/methylation domain-containing protein
MVWKYLFDGAAVFLNDALEKTTHRPIEQAGSRARPRIRIGRYLKIPSTMKKRSNSRAFCRIQEASTHVEDYQFVSKPIDSISAPHREPASGRRRRGARPRGFTLVEVILSMAIAGTAALGALSALMFAYRMSDANLRQVTALAAARAVAEQISTLDFTTLAGTTLPVDIPSSSGGTLTVNTWNDRTFNMHGTAATSDDLVLSLRPEITRSNASTLFSCAQIIVRFRWQETAFFSPRTREDSVTLVMSEVATY